MFRIGFSYKHVKFVDSFVFVVGVTEEADSVTLDVWYYIQPKGWRPHNTRKAGQIEIHRKDFDKWTNYIMGADRCVYRQEETLRLSSK